VDPVATRVAVGAANRPHPGELASGDHWLVEDAAGGLRVSLIDGAGHGPGAAFAAHAAAAALAAAPTASVGECLRHAHEALRATRGAVMSVAFVDAAGGSLALAGVGNVEAALLNGGAETHPVTQRGMLGLAMPRIRPLTIALGDQWTLVLYSDGVRGRFTLRAPEFAALSAQELADAILRDFARADDDATVVVLRSR